MKTTKKTNKKLTRKEDCKIGKSNLKNGKKIDFIYNCIKEEKRRKEKVKRILLYHLKSIDLIFALFTSSLNFFNPQLPNFLVYASILTFIIYFVRTYYNKPFS